MADFYHRYRPGYPPAVIDVLVAAFGLTGADVAVDLGCGTGQLTFPLARHVRAVLGVDPEPDMLLRARRAAGEAGVANAVWMAGADTDIPALAALLGPGVVGVVTIGQALHWMDTEVLFGNLVPLVRPGGGVAVVTNGEPLWLQDSDWSRALREFLERWTGTGIGAACGTDPASRRRYRQALGETGFTVDEVHVDYRDDLDVDRVVGGVYSALSRDRLPPPDRRPAFAEAIGDALEPHGPLRQQVRVTVLLGQVPGERAH